MIYETKFLISLLLTLVVEVPIVVILSKFFKIKKKMFRIIFAAIISSTLTIPYLWFIFPLFIEASYYIYIGEIIVFIAESVIYWQLLEVKFWKAAFISLVANLTSVLIGLLVW